MKQKKERKSSSLMHLFENDTNFLKESIKVLVATINLLLDEKYDQLNEFVNNIIQIEENQDKNRENIITKLFSRESMAFSRADRQKIINDTNDIVALVETAGRRSLLCRPKLSENLNNSVKTLINSIEPIGNELQLMIMNVFNDFKRALKNSENINELRKKVRELEYIALGELYKTNTFSTPQFVFLEDLITNIAKIANRAERFADDMAALITKYSI